MKLAKYLADYIRRERKAEGHVCSCQSCWQTVIQQGIEAFASTEDVRVEVVGGTSRLIIEQIV